MWLFSTFKICLNHSYPHPYTLCPQSTSTFSNQTASNNGSCVLEFSFVCFLFSASKKLEERYYSTNSTCWPELELSSDKPWASALSYTFDNFLPLFETLINQILDILDWLDLLIISFLLSLFFLSCSFPRCASVLPSNLSTNFFYFAIVFLISKISFMFS